MPRNATVTVNANAKVGDVNVSATTTTAATPTTKTGTGNGIVIDATVGAGQIDVVRAAVTPIDGNAARAERATTA